jgi:hypothetical protein
MRWPRTSKDGRTLFFTNWATLIVAVSVGSFSFLSFPSFFYSPVPLSNRA